MNREEKLLKLRQIMKEAGISAVIIPSTDPHSSEYVHEHWKTRAWFSDFNGSAGTLVITLTDSGLWTDFRYYIQAQNDLNGSEIKLYKDGEPNTPTITDYLKKSLKKGDVVGVDGSLFQTSVYDKYKKELKDSEISIDITFDPANDLWLDRPEKSNSKAYELAAKFCGETREEKITKVRNLMTQKGVSHYILASLADIAWLLNIRGEDVSFTPLLVSYLLIEEKSITLFIDNKKLPKDVKSRLELSQIDVKRYNVIGDVITKIKKGSTVYYMPEVLNCYLSSLISEDVNVIKGPDLTLELKAIKNSTEIENLRIAMEKDGAALVKFCTSFFKQIDTETFTEYTLAPILREARLSMEGCVDESFAPIIAFHENGALCHYNANKEESKEIKKEGLLLIDSGGQYYQGTTDITRTFTMGHATVEEILHYTLVLKGHVKLSMAKYPEGTTGVQLDILAREPLWNHGLNYGHGTGHGTGFFLGVHEGPQTISTKNIAVALKEGMVTTNEPGLYIEGKHGIRIENQLLTIFKEKGFDQKFLGFESLTLFPYEIDLIDPELLLPDEINWINNYHREVKKRLLPYLTKEEISWLEEKTREI